MNYSVIGGDLRLSNLAEILAKDSNKVNVFGMENSNDVIENKSIIKCNTLEEAINKSEVIIGSIPFMKNNEEMYATFSDKKIKLNDLVNKKHKDKIFIAGSISNDAKSKLESSFRKSSRYNERGGTGCIKYYSNRRRSNRCCN